MLILFPLNFSILKKAVFKLPVRFIQNKGRSKLFFSASHTGLTERFNDLCTGAQLVWQFLLSHFSRSPPVVWFSFHSKPLSCPIQAIVSTSILVQAPSGQRSKHLPVSLPLASSFFSSPVTVLLKSDVYISDYDILLLKVFQCQITSYRGKPEYGIQFHPLPVPNY